MTKPQSAQKRIVSAAREQMARRSALAKALETLDADVAECALRVFESPRAAADWLVSENIRSLGGEAPVELAKTRPGRLRVLRVLGAIEHGVYL